MCSKIVSNTLIYVTLQQFCRVTGPRVIPNRENSGQPGVILDMKLKFQVLCFCITLRHCRFLLKESNNCLVILGAIKRFCVVALYFRLGL